MRNVLVLGAGGFIGNHLVNHHKSLGDHVTGVDLSLPKFSTTSADRFVIGDLGERITLGNLALEKKWDIVYHFAADMGGAGYVGSKKNDANIMSNSLRITLNILDAFKNGDQILIFASSTCVYPERNQMDLATTRLDEASAYPAEPDTNYGWEKLMGERLCQAFVADYGMDNRILRLNNVYGPICSYNNGKEKVPAAICRKVIESKDEIRIWGSGEQVRSFLYIDDFLDAVDNVITKGIKGPVNVGNEHAVTVNELAKLVIDISGKNLKIVNEPGPMGVNVRICDNTLIRYLCGWEPKVTLREGMTKLYRWIESDMGKEV